MIKTVSFAPPRASSSRSTAKAATPVPAAARKTGGRAASGSPSPQASLSFSFEEAPVEKPKPVAKPVAAPADASVAAKAKLKVEKPTTGKPATEKVEKPKLELKGKKVRAPKDLAVQYGAKETARPEAPLLLEAESPKKRLTKVQREARKVLIKPDEGLLERLARATQIPTIKVKSEPRGKGWKFMCGRCGNTSYFQTQAGLCDCGAIAIKD